ncbi:MAG: prephenate dehydratase domain-containing protein [Patescibacteria group bacterium]|jgi:prephenate dehydratase
MSAKIIIGVSGNKGSFTEEAAKHYCTEEKIQNYELAYLTSVENVLRDLGKGKIDKGVFPIENSTGGVVIEAVEAMARYIFAIEKMFEIEIKMNLLMKKGIKPEDIKSITSHQQALRQCRMYLKRKYPKAELCEYPDTATAAKDLADGVLPETTAVIAPKICAELYDLELAEEGIQDLKFNFTSFIVAANEHAY